MFLGRVTAVTSGAWSGGATVHRLAVAALKLVTFLPEWKSIVDGDDVVHHKKERQKRKHLQMSTYKMTAVSAEEAKSGGRTKKWRKMVEMVAEAHFWLCAHHRYPRLLSLRILHL